MKTGKMYAWLVKEVLKVSRIQTYLEKQPSLHKVLHLFIMRRVEAERPTFRCRLLQTGSARYEKSRRACVTCGEE